MSRHRSTSARSPASDVSLTMRPSWSLITLWACSATVASWVMRTIVWPLLCSWANVSRMISPVLVSRLPVGSSARMSAGSLISARAMATRWIWPPESWLERCGQCDFLQPRHAQRARRPGVRAPARHTRIDERKHHVADDGGPREQVEGLEHEADSVPSDVGELIVIQLGHVLALEEILAAGRGIKRPEQMHQCRFSRARRTHDRQILTRRNAQVHSGQRDRRGLGGVVDLYQVPAVDHAGLGVHLAPHHWDQSRSAEHRPVISSAGN